MVIDIWRPKTSLRRTPFRALDRMEHDADEMFNRFFRGWPRGEAEPLGWSPAIDVVDRKDELVLRADLPGMNEKDIQISANEGYLTIRGERTEERESKEGEEYYCCERWSGAFSRSFALPRGVDAERANASFKNGVLEVHLPKTKEAEGKSIEIKAA